MRAVAGGGRRRAGLHALTAHNAGPSIAREVVVADPLAGGVSLVAAEPAIASTTSPALVSCSLGDIPPREDRTATVRVRVDPALRAAVANTATVATATPDPEPGDDSATVTTPVSQDADVALAKTAPATVRAGEAIAWRLDAVDRGPSTAADVTLADDVPPGVQDIAVDPAPGCSIAGSSVRCALGALGPGDARSVTVSGHVAPDARGTIQNTALLTTSSAQSDTGDDSASASTAIEAEAQLGVEKSADPPIAVAGQPLTYHVTVTNAGPSTGGRATLVDALPDGFLPGAVTPADACGRDAANVVRCAVDGLAPGERREIAIAGRVDPAARGALRNAASVTSDTPDPTRAMTVRRSTRRSSPPPTSRSSSGPRRRPRDRERASPTRSRSPTRARPRRSARW